VRMPYYLYMLIPLSKLSSFWGIVPDGVVHVGAHRGEEIDDYKSNSFGPVIWIEAQPGLFQHLEHRVDHPSRAIHALVWNVGGIIKRLHLTNNGQSSSVFDLGSHKDNYPEILVTGDLDMTTSRLDDLLGAEDTHNFLNLDIQGAEYEALEGLGSKIDQFDFVYCEVNRAQVYVGIKQVGDLDEFLETKGFRRVATVWTDEDWGDALYLRVDWAVTAYGSKGNLNLKMRLFQLQLQISNFSLPKLVAHTLYKIKKFIGKFG
jgi:FkbM family methyltransferase